MLTIVHGNDISASRKFFLDQKDKNSLTFDAESIILSELEQSLSGGGFFESGDKIFIENLFSRKSAKNLNSIAEILAKTPPDQYVYIWSDKEQGVKTLSLFPKHVSQNFKIPQNIFGFLDGIRPQSRQNVSSFHDALKSSEPEIIFFMLIRQFRLLIGISSESKEQIDEVKRLAPWQKSKLVRQAQLFGNEKLKEIYKKIYKIDKNQKTGGTSLTLTQDIDILLLEI